MHLPFKLVESPAIVSDFATTPPTPPDQLRWDPLPMPEKPTDFIDGWVTMAGNGAPEAMKGCAIHLYAANQAMENRFFYNADGELLIVPQHGRLLISTELGRLEIEPQEIAVIPRGVRFRVELPDGAGYGVISEAERFPLHAAHLRQDRTAAAARRAARAAAAQAATACGSPDGHPNPLPTPAETITAKTSVPCSVCLTWA